jgi:hypothetical protein
LDGGFVAAAHCLVRPESTFSITQSLVDLDGHALEIILGVPPGSITKSSTGAIGSGASSGTTGASGGGGVLPASFIQEVAPALTTMGNFLSSTLLKRGDSSGNNGTGSTSVPASHVQSTSTASASTANAGSIPDHNHNHNPLASVFGSAPPLSAESVEAGVAGAKQLWSGFGKRMSLLGNSSLETLKKSGWVGSADGQPVVEKNAADANGTGGSSFGGLLGSVSKTTSKPAAAHTPPASSHDSSSAFVIDDDDEENVQSEHEKPDIDADPTKISISKTSQEKAQALAMHKLAGVRKGDSVIINKENLPGALLFPAMKYKTISQPLGDEPAGSSDIPVLGGISQGTQNQILVHRFLVVTRERLIVLDSQGAGIGATAVVKSNHHLTEVSFLFGLYTFPENISNPALWCTVYPTSWSRLHLGKKIQSLSLCFVEWMTT